MSRIRILFPLQPWVGGDPWFLYGWYHRSGPCLQLVVAGAFSSTSGKRSVKQSLQKINHVLAIEGRQDHRLPDLKIVGKIWVRTDESLSSSAMCRGGKSTCCDIKLPDGVLAGQVVDGQLRVTALDLREEVCVQMFSYDAQLVHEVSGRAVMKDAVGKPRLLDDVFRWTRTPCCGQPSLQLCLQAIAAIHKLLPEGNHQGKMSGAPKSSHRSRVVSGQSVVVAPSGAGSVGFNITSYVQHFASVGSACAQWSRLKEWLLQSGPAGQPATRCRLLALCLQQLVGLLMAYLLVSCQWKLMWQEGVSFIYDKALVANIQWLMTAHPGGVKLHGELTSLLGLTHLTYWQYVQTLYAQLWPQLSGGVFWLLVGVMVTCGGHALPCWQTSCSY